MYRDKKCPKCSSLMEHREHDFITERHLEAPYYFKEWDYCVECGFLQHDEKYKVTNNNKAYRKYEKRIAGNQLVTSRHIKNAIAENEQQRNFFKSL